MKKTIPFVPFPLKKALKISKKFYFISDKIAKFSPFLQTYLAQAGFDLKTREYVAIAVFSSFFWFFLLFMLMLPVAIKTGKTFLLFIFPFFFSFLSYFYIILYPKLLIARKIRSIEKNLLFAVRHLYIQVKSGVSLFDAMVSIAKANYGEISKQFNECVKSIAAGEDQIKALEKLAYKNPSLNFRRIVWQIINSLRSGVDVGDTLARIANHLSEEQKVSIRRYGSQLSPLALLYLMFSIILPTLGITFLIVFSTFSGIQIPEFFFYFLLAGLAFFQFVFIGLIKSRRPCVEA